MKIVIFCLLGPHSSLIMLTLDAQMCPLCPTIWGSIPLILQVLFLLIGNMQYKKIKKYCKFPNHPMEWNRHGQTKSVINAAFLANGPTTAIAIIATMVWISAFVRLASFSSGKHYCPFSFSFLLLPFYFFFIFFSFLEKGNTTCER